MLEEKQKWKTILQRCSIKTKVKNDFAKMLEAKQKGETVLLAWKSRVDEEMIENLEEKQRVWGL